ncbi:NAD(P)H-binding protein [Euzebya pacifica]|jgi:NAD(P)H dehydrogenase (quinone)|uniref:NAD(P)H-binding protein n=1 Tax=Euzebya pacifica TaxID=1608957 RepID=UPI0030F4E752
MKVAVTSASGKLGAEIVKACLELLPADDVIGLARTPERAAHLGVEIRPGDYEQRDALESSLVGVDVVLLVSGMDAPDKRIGQHRNVIEAARAAGVRKIVYTSIQGAEEGTAFTPIVRSNRQTEQDVRESGLDWVVGRNGIYIEPDIEYLDRYVLAGGISNSAGDGRCGYTTRPELAHAYARMMTSDDHNGHTYDLHGQALTQAELAAHLNDAFGTDLTYTPMSVEEYRADRIAELGEFMGTIIAGIYQGIREGAADRPSHYLTATGRNHLGWDEYFSGLAAQR